ncbi:nucleotidyltransferase family protein [Thalassotalea euphylliae]|uniref:nucleotidyltransferase domain-containing protein n=1 Tax=Thalassotalea euphylliae TaxID=1655234 RepID=UPI0036326EA1
MNLLLQVWRAPDVAGNLTNKQWQLLVGQARSSYVLASLGHKLHSQYKNGNIPERVWRHMANAIIVADKQKLDTHHELMRLNGTFSRISVTATLLKGAAYSELNLPVSKGRVFSDIDLLFPRSHIETVEKELWFSGYIAAKEDDYDKRYYRQWMHEIEPLQHIKRKTVLDIHHNILPVSGKTEVNLPPLLEGQSQFEHFSHINTLSEEALILHCATHLFHEGEFEKGFRDLSDIASLFEQYLKNHDSLKNVIRLAEQTNLILPLYLAIRYSHKLFNIGFSKTMLETVEAFKPTKVRLSILDRCYCQVLQPFHSSCRTKQYYIASMTLYLRAHLLRMPLRLLIPHLIKKSIRSVTDKLEERESQKTEAEL